MGFNTVVLILNDRLGEIERDAENFVKEMCLQAGGGGNMGPAPLDFHRSQSSIIETHHADQTAVILVGGNTATVIGFARGWRHTEVHNQVRILEEMLAQYGYGIRRKPLKDLKQKLKWAKHTAASARSRYESFTGTMKEYFVARRRTEQADGMVDWLYTKIENAEKVKESKK
tara:strand:- start:1754 stop:2269 length:516 start_codon:yes stop_codon:yes gene_type:complete